MKKKNLDFTEVRALHQAGQLDLAESGYRALLRKNPRDIEILHSLAILYAESENFDDAIKYLQTAIQYQPTDPVLQLHLANILKFQGLYGQAADVLQKTIQTHPDYMPAINNLGTVYYSQGKLAEATQMYRDVIQKHHDYIDAYYNLGLALTKLEKLDDAIETYQSLLKKSPEHFAARFHLACLYMKQEKIDHALREFLIIEESQPFHLETQSNIATCYLKKGALNEARTHYLKALELAPNDTQILFNLGVINMQLGNTDSAIQHYQKVVRINPDLFAAHNNLGSAFLAKQHPAYALHHFKEALRLQPNNEAIRYTVTMLSQNQRLLAAPPDYVKSLFDSYADHYEQHLLTALDYQVPTDLYKATSETTKLNAHSLDILDLGCGTGLCGVPFKPFANTLTGVDLSEKMLEVAQQKNMYDTLVCRELDTFLAEQTAMYDLILAGDVLVYMGDLKLIFQHASQALRGKGLFTFNAEISEDTDFKMNQSGRFSHQKEYIDQLAKQNHFKVMHYQVVKTRMQNNEPVYGHVYVLLKEMP